MQKYKIADIIVLMDIKHDLLKSRAEKYLYNGKADADATLILEEKVMEKGKAAYPDLDDGELEYLLYGVLFYDKLLDFDGMLLHASAVAAEGRAYLFSADSGVGKSTHTAYWKELIKDADIINDDKPAIRFMDGALYVYGTPFSGKHDISINDRFLLGGICFLERGEQNEIAEIDTSLALPLFLAQSPGMHQKDRVEKKLAVADKVLSFSNLYKMKCINDISAAKTSYEKMRMTKPVCLKDLLPLMEEMLEKNMEVTFTTNGNSMLPLLKTGESVTLKRFKKYKKGDVVLFRKDDGSFVLHRIYKLKKDTVFTQGDSLIEKDAPITKDKILGKAVNFVKKEKTIEITDFSYKIYKLKYVSAVGRVLRKLKRKI